MRTIKLNSKKVKEKGFPGQIREGKKIFVLTQMYYFGGDKDRYIKYLKKNNIKYRSIKFTNPKGMGGWLIYTLYKEDEWDERKPEIGGYDPELDEG